MDVTPQYLLSFSFAVMCWVCGLLALGGIRFLASPGRRRRSSPPAASPPPEEPESCRQDRSPSDGTARTTPCRWVAKYHRRIRSCFSLRAAPWSPAFSASHLSRWGLCLTRDSDVALATRFPRRGYDVENFAGRGSNSYRMYPGGIFDLIEGWRKHPATVIAVPSPSILVILVLWISGMVAAVAQLHYLLTRIGSYGLVPSALFRRA